MLSTTALLSTGERAFIRSGIQDHGMRTDLRAFMDYRPISISLDPVPQAAGSARVTLGTQTDVLVAIKADLTSPDLSTPNAGALCICVESSSSMIEEDYQEHERRMSELAMLVKALIPPDFSHQLCIQAGRYAWKLFVDCLIFGADGGQADAIACGVRAALKRVKLPTVVVEASGESTSISLDPSRCTTLDTGSIPVLVTMASIAGVLMVDPTRDELLTADFIVTVAVDAEGRISTVQTVHGKLAPSVLLEAIAVAQQTASAFYSSQQ